MRWCLASSYEHGAGVGLEFLPADEVTIAKLRAISSRLHTRMQPAK